MLLVKRYLGWNESTEKFKMQSSLTDQWQMNNYTLLFKISFVTFINFYEFELWKSKY